MAARLSDEDVVILAYLHHAFLGHYIDFSNKSQHLISNDPLVSKMSHSPDEKPMSKRTGAILFRLVREFERTKTVRDTLFWFMKRLPLTQEEVLVISKAEAEAPLNLGSWMDICSRLFNQTESHPGTVRKIRDFGEKLSEFVEGQVTPELPGMNIEYGNNERKAALVKACNEAKIDPSRVLSIIAQSDTSDPIKLITIVRGKPSEPLQLGGQGEESRYDVFISYSSVDADKANRIREELQNAGISCFMSAKELTGGDQWSDVIRSALTASREVCLLYSPNSAKSEWVLTEWGAAWALNKRIVPILYQIGATKLPERLRALQAIDLHDVKEYVAHVRARLRS